MLNFAERTGSGALTVVWYYLILSCIFIIYKLFIVFIPTTRGHSPLSHLRPSNTWQIHFAHYFLFLGPDTVPPKHRCFQNSALEEKLEEADCFIYVGSVQVKNGTGNNFSSTQAFSKFLPWINCIWPREHIPAWQPLPPPPQNKVAPTWRWRRLLCGDVFYGSNAIDPGWKFQKRLSTRSLVYRQRST